MKIASKFLYIIIFVFFFNNNFLLYVFSNELEISINSGNNKENIVDILENNEILTQSGENIFSEYFELTGNNILTGNNLKSANAIENFRNKEKKIIDSIYNNDSFTSLIDIEEAKKQLDMLSSQFVEISNEFKDIKEKKNDIDNKYNNVKSSITQIIDNIKSTKIQITERVEKIDEYSKTLDNLKKNLDTIKSEIDQTKKILENYITLLYKINNDLYGKDFNIDNIKLIVKSENIADTLSTEDVIKSLTIKLDELLNNLSDKQDKYIDYSKKLNTLKVKYKYEVSLYNKDVDNFVEQKKYLFQLFSYIRFDKLDTDKKFNYLEESKEFLKNEIINTLSISKNKIEDIKIDGIDLSPLLTNPDKQDGFRFFSSPIYPLNKISAYFSDINYKKKFGVDHLAIDIVTPQGTEIYAPANGIVYKIFDYDSVDVNRLIMVHKNGYVTVYIHLNKILVKPGDFVKRGQIIAISGGQPGTKGAGYLSTGPHLHFNIIKNGESIDPLTVMDISSFTSVSGLPEQYHLKYLQDKNARNIDLSNIKISYGNNIYERRKQFLEKVGNGQFGDLALWEDASEGSNIDIDVGICIGYAESSLGRNLSSQRNVGNVGNNDRGNRVGFNSALDGAKSIFSALNNIYLKNHYTIDQLSRFGNKKGSIYASSDFNWQKNITKCLSIIKGYWVSEEHPFRILK